MFKKTVMVCEFEPKVPVRLIDVAPVAAERPALRLNVAELPALALAELGVTIIPGGTLAGAIATESIKLPLATTLIATATLAPPRISVMGVVLLLAGAEERLKLLTSTETATLDVSDPETPLNVIWAVPMDADASAVIVKLAL